ncbi:TonB family protein [Blastomonas marina]|uniref:energy transducer TonB n=1 Tax=Blastomonas marina TaxID=1867408 RepID=UPI002AC8E84C|nr:TonB family protein [Blastomonas marina]WPZ02700.1 TonB family protein [Blastomonas marina]
MSYANTHKGPDPRAMAAATAIQVGIAALVITGLSSGYVPFVETPKPNPTAVIYDPVEPPPPPTPTASPEVSKTGETVVFTPKPRTELPTTATGVPTTDVPPLPTDWFEIPGPTASGTPGPAVTPRPSPTVAYTPTGPVPSSPPASWFSTADYPSVSARRGEEGTVGYRLEIGANGRIESCTVTRSSGHSALDRATCRLLPRRGAFSPARDDTGARVKGTFSAEIVWRLP